MARLMTVILFGAVLCNSPTIAVTNTLLKNASSGDVQENLFYPPIGPPVIETYKNMSDYRILENVTRRLVCYIGSSNPPTLLTWDCYNAYFNTTSNYSQSEVAFSVNRGRDAHCTCWSTYKGSNATVNSSATIKFVVLYPPEAVQANITADEIVYSYISDNFFIAENASITIACSAINGNPPPEEYYWTGVYVESSNWLRFRASRYQRGNISCIVSYKMTETQWNTTYIGNRSRTFFFEVLYPPNLHVSDVKISVIEGGNVSINCDAVGGSTTTQSVSWNTVSSSGSVSSILAISNVSRIYAGTYTCILNYTLVPTYGDQIQKRLQTNTSIDVLYPPDLHVSCTKISVIEGSNVSINCDAVGGSTTTQSVFWNTVSSSGSVSSILTIRNVSRIHAGSYICLLNYTLVPTYGNQIQKRLQRNTSIDVLYPPHLDISTDTISVIEGGNVSIKCDAVGGSTTIQSVSWNAVSSSGANTSDLTIYNVSRKHAGNYTCFLNYTRTPTYGGSVMKSLQGNTFINVQYPPEATDLQQVEITEGVDFNKDCLIESGHVNNLKVFWQKGNETVSSENLLVVKNSKSSDEGFYRCIVHYSMTPTYDDVVSMTLQSVLFLKVRAKNTEASPLIKPPKELPTAAAVAIGVIAGACVGVLATVAVIVLVRKWQLKKLVKPAEAPVYYQNFPPKQVSDSHYLELSTTSRNNKGKKNIYENLK